MSLEEYIYGPGPAIKVELQFEGCFLRNKYDKWMPPSVQEAIKEGRAVGQGGGGAAKDRSQLGSDPRGGYPGIEPGY